MNCSAAAQPRRGSCPEPVATNLWDAVGSQQKPDPALLIVTSKSLLYDEKRASTSSVDKSVGKVLFTGFLSRRMASQNLIAHFLGIELSRLVTTICGVDHFLRI